MEFACQAVEVTRACAQQQGRTQQAEGNKQEAEGKKAKRPEGHKAKMQTIPKILQQLLGKTLSSCKERIKFIWFG